MWIFKHNFCTLLGSTFVLANMIVEDEDHQYLPIIAVHSLNRKTIFHCDLCANPQAFDAFLPVMTLDYTLEQNIFANNLP